MELNPDAYELGQYFTGSCVYRLALPSKWRMKWLVWRKVRVARRQPTSITLQLTRPLDEESGYPSITKMGQRDYDWVLANLQEHFSAKNLKVSELQLTHLKRVMPSENFQEPYDVVNATFTITGAQ